MSDMAPSRPSLIGRFRRHDDSRSAKYRSSSAISLSAMLDAACRRDGAILRLIAASDVDFSYLADDAAPRSRAQPGPTGLFEMTLRAPPYRCGGRGGTMSAGE